MMPSDGINTFSDIPEDLGIKASRTSLRSRGSVRSSRGSRRSFIDGSGSVGSSVNLSSDSVGKRVPRPDEEISEIDKRIQALQAYLDNARTGILSSDRP